jgi:phage tail sheath protein FI
MAFQLSPGVNVSEIDLTTIVPSVATSIGGIALKAVWGPVSEVITISDEAQLVRIFGKPDSTNYEFWFTASNFLAYSSNLKVVRIREGGHLNSTVTTSALAAPGIYIPNDEVWDAQYSGGALTYGAYAAKYPGLKGNSLQVSIADAAMYDAWAYKSNFTDQPTTSAAAAAAGSTFDEIHAIVIDRLGEFSDGVANTVLEVFPFMSKASDAKDDSGNANFYKDVITQQSRYIRFMAHPVAPNLTSGNWGTSVTPAKVFKNLSTQTTYTLTNGAGSGVTAANTIIAYEEFDNADTVDVNLLMAGPTTGATVAQKVITLAGTRKDAMAYVSPQKADVVNAVAPATTAVAYRNLLTSSSYAVMDSGWKYQYDKYNDVYRWVPLNGDTAGLTARSDLERDPWFSPAGPTRGIMRNVLKLAWNPTKAERDTLYTKGINPVMTFPGEGTQLFGDKTLLSKPSAFDRINVRRLFIIIEKAIARSARFSMFEFNDQFTRAAFVNLVEPYLRDIQGRRGITDFRVVCDESNNTGEVIDGNRFVGDIYIKPARSINFIQLNFVAVRTGVSFDEVVGQF